VSACVHDNVVSGKILRVRDKDSCAIWTIALCARASCLVKLPVGIPNLLWDTARNKKQLFYPSFVIYQGARGMLKWGVSNGARDVIPMPRVCSQLTCAALTTRFPWWNKSPGSEKSENVLNAQFLLHFCVMLNCHDRGSVRSISTGVLRLANTQWLKKIGNTSMDKFEPSVRSIFDVQFSNCLTRPLQKDPPIPSDPATSTKCAFPSSPEYNVDSPPSAMHHSYTYTAPALPRRHSALASAVSVYPQPPIKQTTP